MKKVSQQPVTDEFVQKTVDEIRRNIARREREAFGNGILWSFAVMVVAFVFVYAAGDTPNFGCLSGLLIFGLWYRFGKGK